MVCAIISTDLCMEEAKEIMQALMDLKEFAKIVFDSWIDFDNSFLNSFFFFLFL